MEKNDIPQIKPSSILDPKPGVAADIPQIKPEEMHTSDHMNMNVGKPKPKTRRKIKLPKSLGIILGVLVIVLLVLGVLIGIPLRGLVAEGQVLAQRGQALKASVATQDISVVKAELQSFQTELTKFQSQYSKISWMKVVPFIGQYYKDGEAGIRAGTSGLEAGKLLLETVEPYADIIGFKGAASNTAKSGADNANNRLEFIVATIKDIAPKMGTISEKAAEAEKDLKTIDPNRYPESFRGVKVREQLTSLLNLAEEGTGLLARSKPIVDEAPYLLGVDEPRRYLILFQNDNELRPTGGFLSAYSIVTVNKGKFTPVSSSDIYSLDAKYTPSIQAPDIFPTYLAGIYVSNNKLRLRDMNWSPDFKTSMETFLPEAKKVGLTGFDAVIIVDTKVLGNILSVIGTIGVPGFGNFGVDIDPKCNCPSFINEIESYTSEEGAVVWSENEPGKIVYAPKNYGKNRKDILGELMNSVLANTLGQSKEKLPKLFEAAWNSYIGKHVMVYAFDPDVQKALEAFNLAGRIQDFDGDYLSINNANLGGRKSNLYVEEEVSQTYKKASDGTIEKTLKITYKNPQKYDGFLNSILPNWTRIYVPKGSTLVSAEGFETPGETTEELGKTVFSGGFKLRPEGLKEVTITYKLPMKATNGSLPLLIQKQGGVGDFLYTTTSGRQVIETNLNQDTTLSIRI